MDFNKLKMLYESIYPNAAQVVKVEQHAPMLLHFALVEKEETGAWVLLDIIPLPIMGDESKDLIGRLFAELRAVATEQQCFVFISEGWALEFSTEGMTPAQVEAKQQEIAGRVAEQPGAIEILQFLLFGKGFDAQATCKIERREKIRVLEKGVLYDLGDKLTGGRFMQQGGDHVTH